MASSFSFQVTCSRIVSGLGSSFEQKMLSYPLKFAQSYSYILFRRWWLILVIWQLPVWWDTVAIAEQTVPYQRTCPLLCPVCVLHYNAIWNKRALIRLRWECLRFTFKCDKNPVAFPFFTKPFITVKPIPTQTHQ